MLLVLCLLVALAALSWPALERPMANQRLRKAADFLRAEWGRARVEAMSSGGTCFFRYAVDGDRYSIECRADPASAPTASFTDALDEFGDALDDPAVAHRSERALPEGVVFVDAETTFDTRAESFQSEMEPPDAAAAGWSEPILFYPDGSTSTTRLILRNEHDRCIELALRGLTGVVTVGQTYSGQE